MSEPLRLSALDGIDRLGWTDAPSPVSSMPALARALGVQWLGLKREDLLGPLFGGNKVRKLDVLLATEPYQSAPAWHSLGAIGSGHLVAVGGAARALGRKLHAHVFWEPPSDGVLENLAFTASGSASLHYYRSRVAMGLSRPGLLLRDALDGSPIIPAGGTTPAAMAGMVRAGLELAEQVRHDELPPPDRVYVALGTGGTAAGLALGMGLGGLRVPVHAVATVERWITSRARLANLVDAAADWLRAQGVRQVDAGLAAPLQVDRSQLGPGYGVATAQSLAACELARDTAHLEPIYTGKAFAAMLADLSRGPRPARVLFWHTAHRPGLPHDEAWRERLPEALAQRLARGTRSPRLTRRLVLAGGALAVAGAAWSRFTGYPAVPGWAGQVLSPTEALVLAAAAEVIAPRAGHDAPAGPAPLSVAANIDRFLVSAPAGTVEQVHQLLGLVEHGTTPLGLWAHRFTALPLDERDAFLRSLAARRGLLGMVYLGLRDLVWMGHYQDPGTWPYLGGYPGPRGPGAGTDVPVDYEAMRAKPGALPKAWRAER